jgi:hypothetical protein
MNIFRRIFRRRATPPEAPNQNERHMTQAFWDSLLVTYFAIRADQRDCNVGTPYFSNLNNRNP